MRTFFVDRHLHRISSDDLMRRTNLPATLMYLASSLLLLTVGGDYLIIFRGKSKHTSLVAPFNKWLLPEEELRNCYGSKFAEHFYLDIEPVTIGRGDTFRRLIARKADPLQCSSRSTPAIELQALMFASQKCVLLHGLYELWSEGNNVDEAVFKGEASIQYQTLLRYTDNANETASNVDSGNGKVTNRVSLNIAASVVEQPWLSSKELHKDILSKFQHMWHRLTLDQGSQSCEVNSKVCTYDFASNVEIDAKGGERGSDVNKKEFSTSSGDKRSSSSVLEMRIYVDDARGYCALCRQLTKGLAAPTNSGERK